jgi:D-alanyl-lipoteichoic acid acyltransferase DltB (MBOAT superfamily)
MIFNSLTFLLFFITFFLLYWFVFSKSVKKQNLILLVGSYVFYAWVDYRFLFFLIGVSALNFVLGIYIEKQTKYKRLLLYIGLLQGLGCLVFFKYYNFFISSFNDVFHSLSVNLNLQTLNIIIPLGISFFTFRTISYILDVEKGKIVAAKNWLVFFNYVSFFPSLLSGPIDKAKSFVPQLEKQRVFDYAQATDGMRQILWGLFKKVVIADNCATFTNLIFDNAQVQPGSDLLLGGILYSIQVYADFSGYSDMAIGLSRLIGFNVTKNFDFPFFSQNIAEFWRKWHISLTTWLTEYVFTPLSIKFRDLGKLGLIFSILINFTIIGIWHGANWCYIIFGFVHGCYFIPLIIKGTMSKKNKAIGGNGLPKLNELFNMFITYILVMLTFILFRAHDIKQAVSFYSALFSFSLFKSPTFFPISLLLFILSMLFIEWKNRNSNFGLSRFAMNWPILLRLSLYMLVIIVIFENSGRAEQFIYFQF